MPTHCRSLQGPVGVALVLSGLLAPKTVGGQPPGAGTAVAWGSNGVGELGDPAAGSYSLAPVIVSGPENVGDLDGVVAVAAGASHSLALLADGSVYAWGSNSTSQLGNPAVGASSGTPVQVRGVDGVANLGGAVAIASRGSSNQALLADGTVVGWGRNDRGQLGDGTIVGSRPLPVRVRAVGGSGILTGVAAVATGGSHTLALLADGRVVAWGSNTLGALGDGRTGDSTTPVFVKGPGGVGHLSGVKGVTAGALLSLALMTDGSVMAWGGNLVGELGNPAVGAPQGFFSNVPIPVMGPGGLEPLTGAVAVAAGDSHSLALLSDSTVVAWGSNVFDTLGSPTRYFFSGVPVPVLGADGSTSLRGVAGLAAGRYCSLALRVDGALFGWGHPAVNGSGRMSDAPVQIKGLDGEAPLTGVVSAACSTLHAVAVSTTVR